jgi:hypothetical protein
MVIALLQFLRFPEGLIQKNGETAKTFTLSATCLAIFMPYQQRG